MAHPVRPLPVLQNWDCHVCGTCCKEYQVAVTEEEQQRIEQQGWDRERDLGGLPPFVRYGPPWRRITVLNHREDGSCVFLSEQGRCRIHERFGYDTKPLACRLYPFVLVPVGDHWRVGVRFACPSAAANKGRPVAAHGKDLEEFAARLAKREGLKDQPDGSFIAPPYMHGSQRLPWPDLLRVVEVLLNLLQNHRDPLERRLRKCLTFASEMRNLNLDAIQGPKLAELLKVLEGVADADTPANLMLLRAPRWVGRILFRHAVAIYTRKDHGPNRGVAGKGRLALLRAAWRFVRGTGTVPRMHALIPETTFEQAEEPRGPLPNEAEQILERYYLLKVGALQFCGAASFGLPFWEGFESLVLTFPILLFVSRLFRDLPRDQAVVQALSIVDDHVGFNRVLARFRQRLSFRILARTGELSRLIAWYSR
jgi:lysine-N-methylase